MDMEAYTALLERVTRLEERMDVANLQRTEIKEDLGSVKALLLELKNEREKERAKIGGILWAASAMVAFVSTVAKVAWDWFNHSGGTAP